MANRTRQGGQGGGGEGEAGGRAVAHPGGSMAPGGMGASPPPGHAGAPSVVLHPRLPNGGVSLAAPRPPGPRAPSTANIQHTPQSYFDPSPAQVHPGAPANGPILNTNGPMERHSPASAASAAAAVAAGFPDHSAGSLATEGGHGSKRKYMNDSDEAGQAGQDQRKISHKEVERRRREAINEGINALAAVVPNCEKAKNSVLTRAYEYIKELQGRAQMADELLAVNSSLEKECQRAWAEAELWKNAAKNGTQPPNVPR